jgi:hypothetical protein
MVIPSRGTSLSTAEAADIGSSVHDDIGDGRIPALPCSDSQPTRNVSVAGIFAGGAGAGQAAEAVPRAACGQLRTVAIRICQRHSSHSPGTLIFLLPVNIGSACSIHILTNGDSLNGSLQDNAIIDLRFSFQRYAVAIKFFHKVCKKCSMNICLISGAVSLLNPCPVE